MATLDFLGLTNIAVRLVREKFPAAELYEGDGTSPSGPTTDVAKINEWRYVFRAGDGGTAIIKTVSWGEFGPIEYIDQPWVEDVVIPWPVDMDITAADALLKKAGFTGPYGAVTLRWPLGPQKGEPCYIFGLEAGQYVFVGIYSKTVHTGS